MWSGSKKWLEMFVKDLREEIRVYNEAYHKTIALKEQHIEKMEELIGHYDALIEQYEKQGSELDKKGFISFYDKKGNLLKFQLRESYYNRNFEHRKIEDRRQ